MELKLNLPFGQDMLTLINEQFKPEFIYLLGI